MRGSMYYSPPVNVDAAKNISARCACPGTYCVKWVSSFTPRSASFEPWYETRMYEAQPVITYKRGTLDLSRFQFPRMVNRMLNMNASTGMTMPKLSATAIVLSQ